MIALARPDGCTDCVPRLADLLTIYKQFKLPFAADQTLYQHDLNLRRFGEYLGHDPTILDLRDDAIAGAMVWMIRKQGLAPASANKLRDNLCALWKWAAGKRIMLEKAGLVVPQMDLPEVPAMTEPERLPVAWTRAQLAVLWDGCSRLPGMIGTIPAAVWMHSLHAVCWDSVDRITAVTSTRWRDVDLAAGWITLRAEVRKGHRRPKLVRPHPSTIELLRRSYEADPRRDLIWEWPYHRTYLWRWYRENVLIPCGLPADRDHSFHALRRSGLSYVDAAGGDAQRMAGHSSRETTERHYIDPRVSPPTQPSDLLFRPGDPPAA